MGEREMLVDVVTINTKEYKKLVESQARINIFVDYITKERYINREDCARFFGVVPEEEEEDS